MAREVEADQVFVTADFGPYGTRRDAAVEKALAADGRRLTAGRLPLRRRPGRRHHRRRRAVPGLHPLPPPVEGARLGTPGRRADRRPAGSPACAPNPSPRAPTWAAPPSSRRASAAGLDRLVDFADRVADYSRGRDFPAEDATSRLSVYLKYGCVHPRQALDAVKHRKGEGAERFRAELAWRDFYASVLAAFPWSARHAFRPEMAAMKVDTGPDADRRFEAWAEGRTGYPIVDAGMRQLNEEAWVHNRVRMVVASFLVKDLHLDWLRGADHFLDRLQDGDLASNHHGWQWVAGTGTDPAPYFRIFNPTSQGKKFDPDGDYVRRWVPELRHVVGGTVHEPWKLKGGAAPGLPHAHRRPRRGAAGGAGPLQPDSGAHNGATPVTAGATISTMTERRPLGRRDGPGRRRLLLLGAHDRRVLPAVVRRPPPPPGERGLPRHHRRRRAGRLPPLPPVPAGRGPRGRAPGRHHRRRLPGHRGRRRAGRAAPSADDLAAAAGMTRSHFHRSFKAVTGLTPKAYATEVRNRRVREALAGSRRRRHRHRRHLRRRLQLQRPLLRHVVGHPRHDPHHVPGGRRRAHHPLRRRRVLPRVGPGGRHRRRRVRHLPGRRPRRPRPRPGGPLPRRHPHRRRRRAFEQWMSAVVALVDDPRTGLDLPLDVRGTAFQQRVWQALRAIPAGRTADLLRDRGHHRRPHRRPGRGRRLRGQQAGRRHPLPPGRPHRRLPVRLPLGRRPQAPAPGARSTAVAGVQFVGYTDTTAHRLGPSPPAPSGSRQRDGRARGRRPPALARRRPAVAHRLPGHAPRAAHHARPARRRRGHPRRPPAGGAAGRAPPRPVRHPGRGRSRRTRSALVAELAGRRAASGSPSPTARGPRSSSASRTPSPSAGGSRRRRSPRPCGR